MYLLQAVQGITISLNDEKEADQVRGLGALCSEKFAAEGSNVAINYVASADRAVELAEKIKSKYGVKVVVLRGVSIIQVLPKYTTDDLELNRMWGFRLTVRGWSSEQSANLVE